MKSPRSFTLLEIMVAFLVMAVLSALAIPSLIGVINNDQKNADSVTAVNTADKVYYTAVQAGTSATPSQSDYQDALRTVAPTVLPLYGSTNELEVYFSDGNAICITTPDITQSSPGLCASGTVVLTVPGPPTDVAGVANTAGQSSVSWTAPSITGGSPVTSYAVQYSSNHGSTWTPATSSTSASPYVVTGLSDGTSYEFEVAAINSAGQGSWSTPSPATVPTGAPSTPSPTVTTNTTGSMSWSWPASTDGSGAVTYYWSLSPSAGSCPSIGAQTTLTLTCTGQMTQGVSYTLSVYAQDSLSRTSAVGMVTATALQSAPTAPTDVTGVSNTSQQTSLSWTAPSSNGGAAITKYTIQYSSDSGSTWTLSTTNATTNPYTVTGLTNGTTYIFRVAATNSVGTGPYSTPSDSVTPTTAPSVPVPVVSSNTVGSMSWSWPASTDGTGLTTYYYNISPTPGTCTSLGAQTTLTLTCTGQMTQGVSYTLSVYAQDSIGRTSSVGSVTATDLQTAPTAPTDVVGVANTAHQSAVSWTTPSSDGGSSITSYTIQYSSDSGATWTISTTAATVSPYDVAGLTDGTSYEFRVAATNSVGTSPYSSPSAGVTPTSAPTTPIPAVTTNVSTATGTMTWSWSASTDGSGTVTYYYNLSPTPGSCPATGSTTSLSVTCTQLSPGTTYTFLVYAQDSLSRTSSVGAVTAESIQAVPGAPTGVTGAADTDSQSSVSWTAPSANGGATITSYSVQYSSDSGSTWTTAGTSASSPYTVTGLTNGTPYEFEVAATNSVGTGNYSSPSAAITPTAAPSAPSPSVTTNSNQGATGTMTWTWGAVTGGKGAVSYYYNLTPAAGACATTGSTTSLNVTCAQMAPGTSYTFSVYAQDSLSRTSSVGSVTATPVQVVPGAPTGVTAVADTDSQSSVSWTAPSSNGGAAITSYSIQYATSPYSSWTTAGTSASSPYSVTGLTNGTPYKFEVAATNSIGTGNYSSPSAAITPTGSPSTPSPAVTTNSNQGATGTMTWSWSASTGGKGTLTYYYNLTPSAGACSTTGSTTSLNVTCAQMAPGTSYTFSVYAQDSLSRTSSVGSATASSVQSAPGAPTGVTGVSDTAGQSSVAWTNTYDGGSSITGYTIQVAAGPSYSTWSATNCTNTATNPCTVTGLTDGTSYKFRVNATNAIGTSAYSSASGPVTPTGAPTVPSPSLTTNTNQGSTGTMTWTWSASTDGNGTITYYWSLSPSTGSCSIGAGTARSLTCTDVVPGTSYTLSVYAQDSLSRTSSVGSSSPATALQTAPGTPTGVSGVSDTANQSALSWTGPASNGGSPITGYTVRYSSNSGATWSGGTTTGSSSPSYTLTGLTDGTSYIFEVAATNAISTGSYSSASGAVTPTGAPTTPSPSVTTNTNQGSTGTMTWTWSASTDGHGAITYYYNLTPSAGACSTTGSQAGLSVTCAQMVPGTSYTFSVYAQDALSRTSSVGSVTATAVQAAPGAPTGVSGVSDTAHQSALSWTAPSNNGGSTITSYTVRYSSNGGTTWSGGTASGSASPSYTVTGLTDGTSYIFEVAATNAIGTSGWSSASSSVTPTGAPSTPSPTVTTNTNQGSTGTMTWTWGASTDGHGTVTYYYNLSTAAGACATSGSETTLSVTCAQMVPGTSYTFSVYAQDALSRTSSTGTVTATATQVAPGAPTGPTAAVASATSALVNWSAPSNNGGSTITGYTVYGNPAGTCTTSGATSCTVTGLTNGSSYTFSVTATNAYGTSGYSSSTSSLLIATVPSAPTGLSASGANGVGTIPETWSMPGNGGSAITSYTLRYSTSSTFASGVTTVTGITSTPYSITGLGGATEYVEVEALNVIGTGAWSSADTVIWTNTTQYISGYTYSCPSGGTLSGTTCNIAQVSYSATVNYYSGYYCVSPWGPATGSSTCQRTISSTQANCVNNGGTWHSNNSTCTLFSSANYGTDGGVFGSYDTCPSGGTLTGSICITVYASSYGATATPVYSWYYAYRG